MGRRFWAGALAFCLCLAGCAGAEQEPGEVSSHLLGGGSSGPEESRESEPEEGRPLSFTLQPLPSEKVEAALTGDGGSWNGRGKTGCSSSPPGRSC